MLGLQYHGSWRPQQQLAADDREQATPSDRASSPPLSPNVRANVGFALERVIWEKTEGKVKGNLVLRKGFGSLWEWKNHESENPFSLKSVGRIVMSDVYGRG